MLCSILMAFYTSCFFFDWCADHRNLHSFPTRRSSDLPLDRQRPDRRQEPREEHDPSQAELAGRAWRRAEDGDRRPHLDRKSTRLNSSHVETSYAVFCLKKKTKPL